jgi:hypothetical protein
MTARAGNELLESEYTLDDAWMLAVKYADGRVVSVALEPRFPTAAQLSDLQSEIGDLDEPIALVHSSSPLYSNRFDPTALIRAANRLHRLGKDDALRVLELYCRISMKDRERSARLGLDEEKVFPILCILFTQPDGAPIPMRQLHVFGSPKNSPFSELIGAPNLALPCNDDTYPFLPLMVIDDIPFQVTADRSGVGVPSQALSDIEVARGRFKLREKPLCPKCSPVTAACRLLQSDNWRNLFRVAEDDENQEALSRACIRQQALRAIASALPVSDDELGFLHPSHRSAEGIKAYWESRCIAVDRLRLHWSAKRQAFLRGVEAEEK